MHPHIKPDNVGEVIRNKDYRSPNVMSALRLILCNARLVLCKDLRSWTKRTPDGKNPFKVKFKGQRFLPAPVLAATKYLGPLRKAEPGYTPKRYRYHPPPCPPAKVTRDSASKVPFERNVREACRNGTGLRFDFESAQARLFSVIPPGERWEAAKSIFTATGCITGHLVPAWNQERYGALIARGLALQSLVKEFRNDLVSIDGMPLWEVDFMEVEPNLYAMVGGDADKLQYGFRYMEKWGKETGLHRDAIKQECFAAFHGRTPDSYREKLKEEGIKSWKEQDKRIAWHLHVVGCIEREFPNATEKLGIGVPKRTREEKDFLNHLIARLLMVCLWVCIGELGLKYVGLPLYDGWVFPAENRERAEYVRRLFIFHSQTVFGKPIYANLKMLTPFNQNQSQNKVL
jgi:hypothetical protein